MALSGGNAVSCELCEQTGGRLVWENELARVVLVDDKDYPGFCRVILNRHQAEMTDLSANDRQALMLIVFAVEDVLRAVLRPNKINLASLGNMVPHVHWHIIPRFTDDAHFPSPIWAARQRDGLPPPIDEQLLQNALRDSLAGGHA